MKALNRRFVSSDQAVDTKKQHRKPCADCPFGRNAIPGWTGATPPNEYVMMTHGEYKIDCHCTKRMQCAGAAIFRANVIKMCKSADILVLPRDEKNVFASNAEFLKHHERKIK